MALWTNVAIALSIVLKALQRIYFGALAKIRHGQVSADTVGFQSNNIWSRAVFGIADSKFGMYPPAKTHPALQIQHGRVVHYGSRSHERCQNHAGFAAIHDVMHM